MKQKKRTCWIFRLGKHGGDLKSRRSSGRIGKCRGGGKIAKPGKNQKADGVRRRRGKGIRKTGGKVREGERGEKRHVGKVSTEVWWWEKRVSWGKAGCAEYKKKGVLVRLERGNLGVCKDALNSFLSPLAPPPTFYFLGWRIRNRRIRGFFGREGDGRGDPDIFFFIVPVVAGQEKSAGETGFRFFLPFS